MSPRKLKLPPQSLDAEISVLGALMIDKEAMYAIADALHPEDFYDQKNSLVFRAILDLFSQTQPIDILSVTQKLKDMDQLKTVGGTTYLTKLIDAVPTASHIPYYAKLVREKKILRDLITIAGRITEDAFDEKKQIDVFLDEVESHILGISQRSITQNFIHVKDLLPSAYERIAKLSSGEKAVSGVPTGFSDLDNLLAGLHKSDLIIVGARPSIGKTSFVLNIAQHVAIHEKVPVGIFSLEMSRDQITDRLISSQAGVPLWALRTGNVKDDADFGLIQNALDTLSHSQIFVEDSSALNILQMRSIARRLQAEHGLGLLIIDYLQLLSSTSHSDNMVQQVTEISRGLKSLGRELNIPIIAVSQLSRAVDQRESRIPRLSDLRESGSIEQDADVVVFLYRKDFDKIDVNEADRGVVDIIVAKHRNGPVGTIKLKFVADHASFRTIDRTYSS